jgi:hypothetical protein
MAQPMRPRGMGSAPRSTALISSPVVADLLTAPVAPVAPGDALALDSDPGDSIGQGASSVDQVPWDFSGWGNGTTTTNYVQLLVLGWHLQFIAPDSQPLAVGSYTGAVLGGATPGHPGLEVMGYGRACTSITGAFSIEELSVGGDGTLLAFAATFVQHCDGGVPALYGDIRFNSTVGFVVHQAAPDPLAFVAAPSNPSTSQFSVTNLGTGMMTLGSFSTAPATSSFSVSGGTCMSGTVASGSSCTVLVTADVSVTTTLAASLHWVDNSARGGDTIGLSVDIVPRRASLSGTPTLRSGPGFAGGGDVTGCGGPTCVEPPDPWIAVGPQNVIQVTNVSVRVSDRTGHLLAEVSIPDFFAEPGGQVFDGDSRIIWDALHGRWLATEMSASTTTGHQYIEVSDSADPLGGWTVYALSYSGILPDFPGLGVSSDKIALSANLYPLDSPAPFIGTRLFEIDAATLLAAPSSLPYALVENAGYKFTIRPAVALSAGSDLQMVFGEIADQNLDVGVATLSGTLAAGTLSLSPATDLTLEAGIPAFQDPPVPLAFSGAAVPPVDGRPLDAIVENGQMWFVAGIPCVPATDSVARSCVRVTEVRVGATPSVVQDFSIGRTGMDVFGGGIGLTRDGSLAVVWSQTSATSAGPISTYASYRRTTDPIRALRTPTLIKAGAGTYTGSRWGDYVGVAQDPLCPGSAWQADEVSNSSGSWTTWVSQMTEGDTIAPCAPASVVAVAGSTAARVSWATPTYNGGSPITGYTATSSPGGRTCSTSGALSCLVTGLTNGTAYRFTVKATTAIGPSPASPPSNSVTPGSQVVRYAGTSRFSTAAAVSAHTFSPGVAVAYIAYAFNFPDALAGAAAAGTIKGPVLLANTTGPLDPSTIAELTRLKPVKIVVLGSAGVISDAVKNSLAPYAVGP